MLAILLHHFRDRLRGMDQFQGLQGGFCLEHGRPRRFRIARAPVASRTKASGQSSGLITFPEAMEGGVAMLRGALRHRFSMVPSISRYPYKRVRGGNG